MSHEYRICGKTIEQNASGVGNCWTPVDFSLPYKIAHEIAAEIIDGQKPHCSDYLATNGIHYRW